MVENITAAKTDGNIAKRARPTSTDCVIHAVPVLLILQSLLTSGNQIGKSRLRSLNPRGNAMRVEKSSLLAAAREINIPEQKAIELWNALENKESVESKFDMIHVLYYLGAMIVIVAMGWFVGVAWDLIGGQGILAIASLYIAIFVLMGSILWRKEGLKVPGGLFITMAVCLIPLAVYGLQRWTGWWGTEDPGTYKNFVSWIKGGWFAMETATLLGGVLALYFYRFPFLTAPIFFTLWFMSMDIAPLILDNDVATGNARVWLTIIFGALMLFVAYVLDKRTKEDFSFWGYFFGTFGFLGGLMVLDKPSELANFIYLLINVGFVLLSVLFQRSVFLVFGSLGILNYFSCLFYRYFSDSIWFPIILSIIGVAIIGIGIGYHKNRQKIDMAILNSLPSWLRNFLPSSRIQ